MKKGTQIHLVLFHVNEKEDYVFIFYNSTYPITLLEIKYNKIGLGIRDLECVQLS